MKNKIIDLIKSDNIELARELYKSQGFDFIIGFNELITSDKDVIFCYNEIKGFVHEVAIGKYGHSLLKRHSVRITLPAKDIETTLTMSYGDWWEIPNVTDKYDIFEPSGNDSHIFNNLTNEQLTKILLDL